MKKPYLTKVEHFFRDDEYVCSNCGCSMKKPQKSCPRCGAVFTKNKYDPQWVDELEMADILFGDNDDF